MTKSNFKNMVMTSFH